VRELAKSFMSSKHKKTKRRKTIRFHFGVQKRTGQPSFVRVRVSLAKRTVTLPPITAKCIQDGQRGMTYGCAGSIWIGDPALAKYFPHPVVGLPAVTRTTLVIPTKADRGGMPTDVMKYKHNFPHIVDMNDKMSRRQRERFIAEHPEILEREIILRPPTIQHFRRGGVKTGNSKNRQKRSVVLSGAKRRAVDAGFISKGFASTLKEAS